MNATSEKREFAQHWLPLTGATAAVGTGAALFSYTTNYFILPLEAAEGWSRSSIALGTTLYMVMTAVMMPLMGLLTDRFGVRKVAPLGLAGYGLLCLAWSLLPAKIPLFYASMLLIGLFCSATSGVVFGPFVARRFERRRGIAVSILLSGSAILLIPLAPMLNAAMNGYGWRAGYIILGLLALLIGLPAALLATKGNTKSAKPLANNTTGSTVREAMQTSYYWKVILGVASSTLALGGFLNQLSPILVSKGISVVAATSFMSLFVLMVVIGRILVGALLDAYRPAIVCFLVMISAAAGAALLLMPEPSIFMCGIVVLLLGAAMGAEGDLQAFLIARRFGLSNFATLFGTSAMCTSACLGLGAWLFGALYDATGHYNAAIITAVALFTISGLCFASLGYQRKQLPPSIAN